MRVKFCPRAKRDHNAIDGRKNDNTDTIYMLRLRRKMGGMKMDLRENKCDAETEVCKNSFRHFPRGMTPDCSCIFGEWTESDVCIHLDEDDGTCQNSDAIDDAYGTDFVTVAMTMIDDDRIDDAVELLSRKLPPNKIRSLCEWIIKTEPGKINRSDNLRIERARTGQTTHTPTTDMHLAINRMAEANLQEVYRYMLKLAEVGQWFEYPDMEISDAIYQWLEGDAKR
jgi:hypothetical protein